MGVSTWIGAHTHLFIFFWKEGVPVMGTVQNNRRSLVREPSVVRWRGGSRMFAERFASTQSRVADRRTGNGGVKPVGGSPESPGVFTKTWVITGSLGTPDARVEEVG